MAFVKGQSGNPGGKPKAVKDVVELARQACPAAIKRLTGIATKSADERAAVAACNALLDRGYGRPTQQVAVSGTLTLEQIITGMAHDGK